MSKTTKSPASLAQKLIGDPQSPDVRKAGRFLLEDLWTTFTKLKDTSI